jgi:hypothetical protein
LDARRLPVGENPNRIAAAQIRSVLARLQPLPMTALFAGFPLLRQRILLA